MPMFRYVPVVDDLELPPLALEQRSPAEAIRIGRSMLLLAVAVREPLTARIILLQDEVGSSEPVGAWTWASDAPEPAWISSEVKSVG